MVYEFSFESFFIGILITLAGIIFIRWHRKIADALGSGISSYDHFKLFALITIILGIIVSLNLHWFILGNIMLSLFRR